ncbi:hypothetical protein ACFIQF_06220 [Comamonas sp. J-3]|uniref:hypothetical protein n=1 Tax=Comamonas trifloxystrobinivorans TaxID=3350256 RepID=UPI00372B1314
MQQYQALKDQHRNTRDGMPEALNLRIHRALSWLNRAEQCEDTDGRFVFLWIAFNAAYAQEIPHNVRLSEQESFRSFLHKLHQLDRSKRLDALVWKEFSGPIRVLLDNPYVFESFWEYQRGNITENQWKERLASGKKSATISLARGNTPELLGLVLQRIYTLRNQLVHGGATWNGSVNRVQLQDCVNLMGKLVPVLIAIMLESADSLWGDACYPVIKS